MSRGLLVVDLGGHGVDGVDLDGHRQFAQVAIVEHAASRRYFKGALLLLLCALNEFLMTDNLKPEEATGNGAGPKEKKQANQPEARPLERRDARWVRTVANVSKICLHGNFSFQPLASRYWLVGSGRLGSSSLLFDA